MAFASAPFDAQNPGAGHAEVETPRFTFDAVYATHAPFVWRSVRRLGVPVHAVDDAVQKSSWSSPTAPDSKTHHDCRLALRNRHPRRSPASTHRATQEPQCARCAPFDTEKLVDGRSPSPHDLAERQQAIRRLYAVLDQMNDERREVFVLYELEQLTAPEIAEALGVNVNTVYWRQRTARQEFEKILRRPQKSEAGSTR